MNRTLVQAQYLKKGMVLANTLQTVTSAPYRDIDTPSRKVKLGVDGWLKIWNKTTEIAILTEE